MVVEGNIRKEGESPDIVVRLVDATTDDAQLWSQSYDRNARDMPAVQQEIAVAAAKQILPQIDPKEIPRPELSTSLTDLMLLARIAAKTR